MLTSQLAGKERPRNRCTLAHVQPLLLKPTWHRVSAEGRSAGVQLFCGDSELTLAAELSATSPGAAEAPWKLGSSSRLQFLPREAVSTSVPDLINGRQL